MKQRDLYRQMPRIACRWQELRRANPHTTVALAEESRIG
jgi:hypothetical protein